MLANTVIQQDSNQDSNNKCNTSSDHYSNPHSNVYCNPCVMYMHTDKYNNNDDDDDGDDDDVHFTLWLCLLLETGLCT